MPAYMLDMRGVLLHALRCATSLRAGKPDPQTLGVRLHRCFWILPCCPTNPYLRTRRLLSPVRAWTRARAPCLLASFVLPSQPAKRSWTLLRERSSGFGFRGGRTSAEFTAEATAPTHRTHSASKPLMTGLGAAIQEIHCTSTWYLVPWCSESDVQNSLQTSM